MSRNCKDVAEQLVECMRQTKCMSEGGELKECLKINPDECMLMKHRGINANTRLCCQKCNPGFSSVGWVVLGEDSAKNIRVERRGYFECKRALLDMRTRIRGRRLGVDNNNLEG